MTLLAATGQIVLEISKYAYLQEQVESLVRVDKRVYGEISLEFWKYKTNGADC